MNKPTHSNHSLIKDLLPRILTGLASLIVFIFVWFGIAGRVSWWQGWVFLFSFFTYVSILMWRLSKVDPELVRERNQPADSAEAWDRVVMGIYGVTLGILLIVCALDGGRYTWSVVPWGVQLAGWCCLVAAGVLIWQVMMTNAYLSSWARIQDDRGQVVIQEGLYRYIRHPMYLGIILGFIGLPLVLSSWWAMIPGMVIVGLFVYRTYREDLMLAEGLEGYAQYQNKVRYRLLPKIW